MHYACKYENFICLQNIDTLHLNWCTFRQPRYEPFLDGVQLAAVAAVVLPLLTESWPVVLEAVTLDVSPTPAQEDGLKVDTKTVVSRGLEINATEFKQVWAMAILVLSDDERQSTVSKRSITSFPSFNGRYLSSGPASNLQLVVLRSLRCLSAKGFYRPDMLSVDLCQELLQVGRLLLVRLSIQVINLTSALESECLVMNDQILPYICWGPG